MCIGDGERGEEWAVSDTERGAKIKQKAVCMSDGWLGWGVCVCT